MKWKNIRLLIRAIWNLIINNKNERYIVRPCGAFLNGVYFENGVYDVYDCHMGAVIIPDIYVFRKHEAQAVANALNAVVPPLGQKEVK